MSKCIDEDGCFSFRPENKSNDEKLIAKGGLLASAGEIKTSSINIFVKNKILTACMDSYA